MSPYKTILSNAGYEQITISGEDGYGIDVVTGNMVHMINDGIIDPLLVTKSALQNAASVASTILSTDCVINNIRINEGSRQKFNNRKIKEGTTKTKGGLLLAENQREDIRYVEANVISVGDEVGGINKNNKIYFDRHAGHKIEIDKNLIML